MKLSLENFQCWPEAEFTIDGLTALVGPSNRGKSSLSRALKGVLRNEIPEEFIRNGQNEELSITFETEEVAVKATRKRKGSTHYSVTKNGATENFSSLGGKLPEAVSSLGFNEVKIGAYPLDPIFSAQNKAQFLIDNDRWKPSELSAILGAFSRTERLDVGKKQANLRLSKHKSEASTLAEEIRKAEERTKRLDGISINVVNVNQEIESQSLMIVVLEKTEKQASQAAYHLYQGSVIGNLLDLLVVPDVEMVQGVATKIECLQVIESVLEKQQYLELALSALSAVESSWVDLRDKHAIQSVISQIRLVYESAREVEEKAELMRAVVEQTATLFEEIQNIQNMVERISQIRVSKETLDVCQSRRASVDADLEVANEELGSVQKEQAKEELLLVSNSNDTCSMCGSILKKGNHGQHSTGKNKAGSRESTDT